MKRVKDSEALIGPMFPRLHVNDTEKRGPKAPPRNKMALYEQFSIPSERLSHAPNSDVTSLRSPLNKQTARHQPEKQYSQYPDFNTSLTHVEQRKKSAHDDCAVPNFTRHVPNLESVTYTNGTEPSYLTHKSTKPDILNMIQHDRALNDENLEEYMAAIYKRKVSDISVSPSEDQNVVDDHSTSTESLQEESLRSTEMKNFERGDSVTSVLDCGSGMNITPDDVVGMIGQKRFWSARRTIVSQQRIFAIQLFELHRLIKVQKLIAASPRLLQNSGFVGEPIKPSPQKKFPSNYPLKPIPNISKQKANPEKPSNKQECSAQNTHEKASFPSIQNDQSVLPWVFNQPQAQHQWLIPVMSPSEGLVYKPYPGPQFVGPTCGGGGPHSSMSNFPTPAYGVPAPAPAPAPAPHPQYQFPSFPPAGPPGYFPPFVINPAVFLGSAMKAFPGETEDTEVQASTASSPSERMQVSIGSSAQEGRNVLPLFPEAPAISPSRPSSEPPCTEPEPEPEERQRPTRVIKVVPHNGRSATESAARIFQSIQEERKQYHVA